MCAYNNEDTQEEDVDMKINPKDQGKYPDTDMILADDSKEDQGFNSKENLGFMNRTKNETPTKSNNETPMKRNTNNNINNTTIDKDRRTKEPTNQTTNETPKNISNAKAKAKRNATPSSRTRSKTSTHNKNKEAEDNATAIDETTRADLNSKIGTLLKITLDRRCPSIYCWSCSNNGNRKPGIKGGTQEKDSGNHT